MFFLFVQEKTCGWVWTSDHQDPQHRLLPHHPQHWLAAGLCVEPLFRKEKHPHPSSLLIGGAAVEVVPGCALIQRPHL